jgi:hypothetical protein
MFSLVHLKEKSSSGMPKFMIAKLTQSITSPFNQFVLQTMKSSLFLEIVKA